MKKLIKPIEAISIHGITGQGYEVGTLEVGTDIKNVEKHEVQEGEFTWTFQASTDGKNWYRQRSHTKPAVW